MHIECSPSHVIAVKQRCRQGRQQIFVISLNGFHFNFQVKQLVSCLPTNVLHNFRFFSCIFIFFSFNQYFDVVVCNVHESCCHVRKKCLTKNFLFAEKAIIYFAKTQCPEAAKTFNACTFNNMFSDWSNEFHTQFLIG